MAELVLKMSITLDGFVAGPGGELDWLFRSRDPEAVAWTVASVSRAGYHAMGSRTFRDMAAFWPTSTEPFAPPMNQIPKLVFSRGGSTSEATTTRALVDARKQAPPTTDPQNLDSWTNARILTGDLGDEMTKLKQQPGKPIYAHGGASFCRRLVELDLVDEYQLLVHAIAIGKGLPLFTDRREALDLKLVDLRRFSGGSVALVYRRR
jgi:dihydrofolate reductase